MNAVRSKLLKKHKTCPQTPLEIEAWMVRDVLKVYVWRSRETWSIIFGNGFAVCFKLWMRHDCLSRLRMDSTYLEFIQKEERAVLYLNGCKNRQFQGCWCDLARVPEDHEGSCDALLKTNKIYPNGFLMPHMYVRGNEVVIDASKPMSRETFVAFTREALFCIGIPPRRSLARHRPEAFAIRDRHGISHQVAQLDHVVRFKDQSQTRSRFATDGSLKMVKTLVASLQVLLIIWYRVFTIGSGIFEPAMTYYLPILVRITTPYGSCGVLRSS